MQTMLPRFFHFQNVYKYYGPAYALRDINLAIAENVTTAVVGPSGSGKSTLLQLSNGLERPNAGRIFVFGQEMDYARLPALRRQIGYAVQGTGLFPHFTVQQNITLLAVLEKWEKRRIRARAEELMNLVSLPLEFSRRYPHELSGGQQQRVGLCRAMMLNPALFLLDEPFGALDPITRHEIHDEFLRLQKSEPRTILLVTHDLKEALKLAQHPVILNRGQIEQSGPCEDVIRHPANDFVASFLKTQLEA